MFRPGLVSGCLSGEDSSDSCAPSRHPAVRPPSSRLRLDRRSQAYLKEVQRILAEVHGVSERQRRWAPAGADRLGRSGGRTVVPAAAPRPVTSRADTLLEEPFYEEQLRPVCSQALLAARGRPRQLARCSTTWEGTLTGRTGFTSQGLPTPDLPRAPACPKRAFAIHGSSQIGGGRVDDYRGNRKLSPVPTNTSLVGPHNPRPTETSTCTMSVTSHVSPPSTDALVAIVPVVCRSPKSSMNVLR